jgi:hypothetical protein
MGEKRDWGSGMENRVKILETIKREKGRQKGCHLGDAGVTMDLISRVGTQKAENVVPRFYILFPIP